MEPSTSRLQPLPVESLFPLLVLSEPTTEVGASHSLLVTKLKSISQLPPELRWGLLFPVIFLNGWLLFLLINFLQPFVSILITAALFAFLLDFPLGWLQKLGFKRGWAVALVFLLALLIIAILGLIVIPLLIQQLSELSVNLPQWIESGNQQLQNLEKWAIAQKLPFQLKSNSKGGLRYAKMNSKLVDSLIEIIGLTQ